MITGSARSVPGFDVYKAIESCKDILENFGGHTYAAGLTLREENLEEFKRRFSIISFDEIEARMMQPKIRIAGEITFDKITPKFINDLALFQPFGPENENPIFLTRNVTDSGKSKLVGKNLQHIKMEIVDPTVTLPMQAIAFCQENAFPLLKEKQSVDICYTIEENTHGKNTYTQLEIKDIRKSNK